MEEVFKYIDMDNKPESVQLCDWPEFEIGEMDGALDLKWKSLMGLRNEVTKSLEVARKDKRIGNSIDAKATVYIGDNQGALKEALANMDMASLKSAFSILLTK